MCLVGALGWAAAGLGMRYLSVRDPTFDVWGATTAQFFCGGVLLLPYLAATGPGDTDWSSGKLWLSLAFLIVGAQVITYVGFYVALAQWASARVFSWTFLVPAVAVVVEAATGQPSERRHAGRHGGRHRRCGDGHPSTRRTPLGTAAGGLALDGRAACGGRPSVVVLMIVVNVAEHCVHLPAVPGRVGDPDLVLARVATATRVALVEGHQPAALQPVAGAFDCRRWCRLGCRDGRGQGVRPAGGRGRRADRRARTWHSPAFAWRAPGRTAVYRRRPRRQGRGRPG